MMISRQEVVEAARKLQRSVLFTFIYCESDQVRYVVALGLMEDIEALREHIALTGWQRCVITGSKRDELHQSSDECTGIGGRSSFGWCALGCGP